MNWPTLIIAWLLGLPVQARAQPLGANPSAAPSEIANPSSINPGARASDIGNPSAINPSAGASQLLPSLAPLRSPDRSPRVRVAPARKEGERDDDPKRRSTKARPAEEAPSCKAGKPRVGNWQTLREQLASCWTVPAGTEGSSVTLRFSISSTGELRGRPMVTGSNIPTKDMAADYRKAAMQAVEQCLPVCLTDNFGATLHESTLHLRLVNDAPFPSRNLGPWMTIFARSRNDR